MSDYATAAEVRAEAGFTGNTNIADSTVELYRDTAQSEVNGALKSVYTLPLSETPSLIKNITIQLGAGLLLSKEYGEEAEGTTKDGKKRMEEARNLINQIKSGKLALIASDGTELARAETQTLSSFPDDDTGTDKTTQGEKDDPPQFEIGEEF